MLYYRCKLWRVVEILLLFFISYIIKAVSLFGNVVITIKPYVMNKIIEKYYVSIGSVLVNYNIGTNGVDCWFDVRTPYVDGIRYVVTQHRCLSFEDFNLIKPNL